MKRKRKLKKQFKILLFLIIIIMCAFIIRNIYNNNDFFNKKINDLFGNKVSNNSLFKSKELMGKKLTNGVYSYKLNNDFENIETRIIEGQIYYLAELKESYELYKLDIYSNKNEKIGSIEKDGVYCYFDNELVVCSKDDKIMLYNNELKKVYDDKDPIVVPYRNDFIKVKDNTLYYKNKEYKRVNEDLTDYSVRDYAEFNDNLFIFFVKFGGNSCIYNLSKNKCEDLDNIYLKKHSDGLFYYDDEKFYVVDKKGETKKEYTNTINKNELDLSELNNHYVYYFYNNYFRIYNLDNNKFSLLDYKISIEANSSQLYNGLFYLISENEVTVIKLDDLSQDEISQEELNTKLENKIAEKIQKIKDDYGVEYKIKKDANLKLDVYNQVIKGETNYKKISDSLDETEDLLNLFGKEFFDEFKYGDFTGISIYLASSIKSNMNMSGEAFRYYDKFLMISLTDNYKSNLCHELMHTMESALEVKNKKIFTRWSSYNPKGFKYKITFNENDSDYKYTIKYGKGDIYFIDNYSQTNELEDRATIFEKVCMNDAKDIINNPYLFKKAKYIESEILKYYPMLKDSAIFDSIK